MNIVILSYRISGNDGVSLECEHWKSILHKMGHNVTFLAGDLDSGGIFLPELHFQWPKVAELHDDIAYGKGKYQKIEDQIFDIAGTIEGKLRKIFRKRNIDLLVVANVLSLPMHFPFAVALTRVIEELDIPTIARHHDFWWERQRYLKSNLFPFFKRWFPPDLKQIRHVVINSISQEELKERYNLDSEIISDSFNFENKKLNKKDRYNSTFRKSFGIKEDDILFLQATRIVPRKRFEIAIQFMQALNNPSTLLLIPGHSGDEGKEYEEKIKKLAKSSGIRHKFIGESVNSIRRLVAVSNGSKPKRKKIYTLWDTYINSDFVIYPPDIEGFGNQFLEAVYFKKPIVITPYEVYKKDIKPLGFETIELEPQMMQKGIGKVRELIGNKAKIEKMTEKNFKIALNHFSYGATENKIQKVISSFSK